MRWPTLFRLFVLWFWCWRIGEAKTPGPDHEFNPDSQFDQIAWRRSCSGGALVGTCNPSGIAGKIDRFSSFPDGWWHVVETHATYGLQKQFSGALRKSSMASSPIRVVAGAPAPFRPGSNTAGTWTGVLQFANTPLRRIELPWPSEIAESGRVVAVMGTLGCFDLIQASVYLPPAGPTFPKAHQLGEQLLSPLTSEIVLGRKGFRVIGGDFNSSPLSFRATRLWHSQGWRELQDLMQEKFGILPTNTCKAASRSDQLWLSPELHEFVTNVGFADVFADHLVMVMQLQLPTTPQYEWIWPQAKPIPWEEVDRDKFSQLCDATKPMAWTSELSSELHQWSDRFERMALDSMQNSSQRLPRYQGRCSVQAPRKRLIHLNVPRTSRPGETLISSSLLGRSVQLWFQQLRRLQSLLHNLKKASQNDQAGVYREQVWHAGSTRAPKDSKMGLQFGGKIERTHYKDHLCPYHPVCQVLEPCRPFMKIFMSTSAGMKVGIKLKDRRALAKKQTKHSSDVLAW